MAALLALMAVVVVSYVIVTVGATMLEITGLDRDTARFQALSAYSGTGFTTRVSELVVRHPVRRRIASMLIITGNAGTAAVIATLIGSFSFQSWWQLALNMALLFTFAGAAVVLIRRFGQSFGDRIRGLLTARLTDDLVPTEELMLYRRGFGITRIQVVPESRICGQRLRETGLREQDLQVLAIEDGLEVHPVPTPDWVFEPGQHLIVYGDLKAVQAAFGPHEV